MKTGIPRITVNKPWWHSIQLSVVPLSVIHLNAILLGEILLIVMPNVVLLNAILLSDFFNVFKNSKSTLLFKLKK